MDELTLPDTSPRDTRLAAMRLLARREHSCKELQQKLVNKGFNELLVEQITGDLQSEGLLSDSRFAESYLRSRRSSGHGPIRIRQELKQRGVSDDVIATVVIEDDPDWLDLACKVREKRFGAGLPQSASDSAKQQRFLQYRGFNHQQLKHALTDLD